MGDGVGYGVLWIRIRIGIAGSITTIITINLYIL